MAKANKGVQMEELKKGDEVVILENDQVLPRLVGKIGVIVGFRNVSRPVDHVDASGLVTTAQLVDQRAQVRCGLTEVLLSKEHLELKPDGYRPTGVAPRSGGFASDRGVGGKVPSGHYLRNSVQPAIAESGVRG